MRQIGPGISVITFTSRVFGRAKIVLGIAPVEPLIQRLVHHIYVPRWQPTFIAKFILYSLAIEVSVIIIMHSFVCDNGGQIATTDKKDCQALLKAKYCQRVVPVASAGSNKLVIFNWVLQVVKLHVCAKFHQAKCSGS